MDKLLIRGGRRLNGLVPVAGAKNAALPELCAALLVAQPVLLHNVPQLQDVATMLKLLRSMGVQAERSATQPDAVRLDASVLTAVEAPYDLAKAGEQRPQRQDRRAHGFDQFVGRLHGGEDAGVQAHRVGLGG